MNDVEMSDPVNDTAEQASGIVEDTKSHLDAIGEKLDRLQAKFDEKLIYDSLKDQQIKQLSDQVVLRQ